MTRKALLSYSLAILLLVVCVFIKQHTITKKNQKEAISFYSSWKKEGKPVLVEKVKKNDLETTWKMTVALESDQTYIGYVPKMVQNSLAIGSPVSIHFQGKKMVGKVTHIDSNVNLDSGMFSVKIFCQEKLGEKNEKYLAEITISGMKNVVILPYDALHMENDRSFVWIIKDNKAHKQSVTLGERNNQGIMAQGIEEHELVILNGSDDLQENDFVKITYGN